MANAHIKRAARLYALAVLAQQDCAGATTDDEDRVVALAIQTARDEIRRLGHQPGDLVTLADCIRVARALQPD